MIVSIQQHHASRAASAMIVGAHEAIATSGIVPAFIYQLAEVWDAGISYGIHDFWLSLYMASNNDVKAILERNGNA